MNGRSYACLKRMVSHWKEKRDQVLEENRRLKAALKLEKERVESMTRSNRLLRSAIHN